MQATRQPRPGAMSRDGSPRQRRRWAAATCFVVFVVFLAGCDEARKFTPSERHKKLKAIEAIGGTHEPSETQLESWVRDRDAFVRQRACDALGSLERPHAALLELCVGDANRDVRLAGIRAAGRHPAIGRRQIEILLGSKIEPIAAASLRALGMFAREHDEATIRRYAADPRLEVRRAALWALGRVRSASATRLLVAALDDKRAEVRQSALAGLLRQPGNAAPLSRVAKMLKDGDFRVRYLAVRVVAKAPANPTHHNGTTRLRLTGSPRLLPWQAR